ncbi:MAG: hypothetical protein IIY75_02170 [Erysipelotrichales bacterium]|nr:hypothetical protein [Erysipelotrichales bacterium]
MKKIITGILSVLLVMTVCGNIAPRKVMAKTPETAEIQSYAKGEITDITANEDGLKITWKKLSGASYYQLYRKGPGEKNFTKVCQKTGTYYQDDNVADGKTYYYKVRGAFKNSSGKTELGPFSSQKAYVTVGMARITKLTNTASGIKVEWEPAAKVTNYMIYRRVGDGSYVKVKTISGSNTSWTDTDTVAGELTDYKIRAYFKSGSGATYLGPYGHPRTTMRLERPVISEQALLGYAYEMKWSKVKGAAGYQVYREPQVSAGYVKIKTTSSRSMIDNDLQADRRYHYKVRAYYVDGDLQTYYSAFSTPVEITFRWDVPVNSLYFPDANFRKYVQDYIDGNMDGKLTVGEADAVKELPVYNKSIASLKGIEAFRYLEDLDARSNKLTEVDLSLNKRLVDVELNNNQITTLKLPATKTLKELKLNNTNITSINLKNFTNLEELDVGSTQLSSLNVEYNRKLEEINANNIPDLKSLNLYNLTELRILDVAMTGLTKLDIGTNPGLLKAVNEGVKSVSVGFTDYWIQGDPEYRLTLNSSVQLIKD